MKKILLLSEMAAAAGIPAHHMQLFMRIFALEPPVFSPLSNLEEAYECFQQDVIINGEIHDYQAYAPDFPGVIAGKFPLLLRLAHKQEGSHYFDDYNHALCNDHPNLARS